MIKKKLITYSVPMTSKQPSVLQPTLNSSKVAQDSAETAEIQTNITKMFPMELEPDTVLNDIEFLQQLLTTEKHGVDNSFFQYLQQLKIIQPQTVVIQMISEFIKNFLLIPAEGFTVKSMQEQLNELKKILYEAASSDNMDDIRHVQTIISGMTNLGAVLTGSMLVSSGLQNIPDKQHVEESILHPPYVQQDEQFIFYQVNKNIQYIKLRPYFNEHQSLKATFDKQYKINKQQKQQVDKKELLSLINQEKFQQTNADLIQRVNRQMNILTDQIDDIDGEIRKTYQLSPPRFPTFVSPIERYLQYYLDVIEILQWNIKNPDRQIKHPLNEEFKGNNSGQNEHSDKSTITSGTDQIVFQKQNPYVFEINIDQDYVFTDIQNQYKIQYNQQFIRPYFLSALSSSIDIKAQRVLFELEVEGQILSMVSILLEQLECQSLSFNDIPALILCTKFLSAFINVSIFYTYGEHGMINKLHAIQKYTQIKINELIKQQQELLQHQLQGNYKSLNDDFLKCTKGFINKEELIFIQFINKAYYLNKQNIIKQQQKNQSLKTIQNSQNITVSNSILSISEEEFKLQDNPPKNDVYISQQLYQNKFPCDPTQFRISIPFYPTQQYFVDNLSQIINRIYLSEATFDIIQAAVEQLVGKIVILCSSSNLTTSQYYKNDSELVDLLKQQLRSIKLTDDFECYYNNLQSYSKELNILLEYYVEQLEKEKKETQDIDQQRQLSKYNRSARVNSSRPDSRTSYCSSESNDRQKRKDFMETSQQLNKLKYLYLKDFSPIKYISKGGYGTVVQVTHKQITKPLVIKILRKEDMIRKNSVNRVKLEATIYKVMEQSNENHMMSKIKAKFSDFVVRFYGSFKSASHLFLVLEFCQHGDLGQQLDECGSLGEPWTKFLIAEIIIGISVMHSCNIIYNDMKPQNVLLGDDGHIKLTDFGISQVGVSQQLLFQNIPEQELFGVQPSNSMVTQKSLDESTLRNEHKQSPNVDEKSANSSTKEQSNDNYIERLKESREMHCQHHQVNQDMQYTGCQCTSNSIVGTPNYLAPELLKGKKPSFESDFWAIGITMYELLYGVKPFLGNTIEEIFNAIINQQLEFPDDEDISEECRDFLKQLLHKNPKKRLSKLEDIQKHSFFKDFDWDDIFRKQAYYTPMKISANVNQVDETFQSGNDEANWVDMIINEQNPPQNAKQVSIEEIDDQLTDFSYTNQQLFPDSQAKNASGTQNITSQESN